MALSFGVRCMLATLLVAGCLICSGAGEQGAPENTTAPASCPHEDSNFCEWGDEWKFECRSTPCCIPNAWKCDGEGDCTDSSDEEDCPTDTTCAPEEFTCLTSGACVPLLFKCDSEDDCLDGSDEDNCTKPCKDNWYLCDNGKCILEGYTCDSDNDCGDWSDEKHDICRVDCAEGEFQCAANKNCVPSGWVCDDHPDCSDGSDELDCETSKPTCGFAMFNCSSGECISATFVCDGSPDCSDSSDERFCNMRCNPESESFCPASNLCVPTGWMCDGEVDCREGDDEVGCDELESCPEGQYNCGTGACVSEAMVCDGKDDCASGLDEFFCNVNPPRLRCSYHQFQCTMDQVCINGNKLCDNVTDCLDGSDELHCDYDKTSTNECETNNGGCEQKCVDTTYSHLCSCNNGYELNLLNRRECSDVNECGAAGTCSQFCFNSQGSYSCSCADGYTLQSGGSICKANGGPAYLLLADQHSIRKIPISKDYGTLGDATILVHSLPQTLAIDVDIRNNKLYWADIRQKAIFRSNLDGSNKETVVHSSLQSPDGIAVDWVSQKVYWTDGLKGTIEVASTNGEDQKVLIWEGLGKPRAIVVDPLRRFMYWSDWGSPAKIERASMDGKNREILHNTTLYWPNALTLDISTERLYWADAKYHTLESSNADGSGRRTILSDGVNHPFALTIFESTIYWTDWRTRSIQAAHKGIQVPPQQLRSILDMPMGIKVVHRVLQPTGEDKCGSDNGGCTGLCLLSSASKQGYSCVCPAGSRLTENGKDCEVTGTFLLAAAVNGVIKVAIDDESGNFQLPFSLDGPVGASDIAWDSKEGLIFWSDMRKRTISVAHVTGVNERTLFNRDLVAPEGVAFDWLTRKLYWVDSGTRRIEVADVDSGDRTVLVSTGLERPRGLAVDPYRGNIYWTDWGSSPRIERAGLDGSNREVVVDLSYGRDRHLPNGITVDLAEKRLYWVEGSTKAIYFANLNGTGLTMLPTSNLPTTLMYGVAVHGDYVYWSDAAQRSIERRVKLPTSDPGLSDHSVLIRNGRMPLGMEMVHRNRETASTPCDVDNGGCSHVCLTRPSPDDPNALTASCKCPTGYRLKYDNKTCASEISEFLLVADKTSIKMVSLDVEALLPTQIPIAGSHQFNAVEYDPVKDEVYWIDAANGTILKVSRKGGDPSVVVSGLGHPKGLALDWVGRNLYFTDSVKSRIELYSLDDKQRGLLLWKDIHTPQSLAIHLESKSLYWVDWGNIGTSMRVEKAFLDGSGRRVLFNATNIVPQGLTVRSQQGETVVYLVDAFSQTVLAFYEATNKLRPIQVGVHAPSSVTVTPEHMIVTAISSPGEEGILVKAAWGGDGSRAVAEDTVQHFVSPMDVKVFDRQEMQNTNHYRSHPCSALSHGCSHLCLPSNVNSTRSRFTCSCPTGVSLKEDGKTCKQAPSKFILYGTSDSLHRVSLETADMSDVVIKGNVGPVVGVDFSYRKESITLQQDGELHDSPEDYIFWTDNLQGTLNRAFFNGSCPNNSCVFFSNLGSPEGLAYDWMSGNIYVIDALSKQIKVVSYDGSSVRTVVQFMIDRPRAVAVHPGKGYLFWSDWVEDDTRIERATLSGEDRLVLVSIKGQFPNGLTIDEDGEWIYWTDGHFRTIHRVRTNGSGSERVVENTGHAFGVAHHDNKLYWTEWSNNSLNSVSLQGGVHTQISRIAARPYGVTVVHPGRRRYDSNPCAVNNGGCPYFCLMRNTKTWTCACPDGLGDQCVDRYVQQVTPTVGTPTRDTPTVGTPTSDTPTVGVPSSDTPPSVTSPSGIPSSGIPIRDDDSTASSSPTIGSTAPDLVTELGEGPTGNTSTKPGPTHTTPEGVTPTPASAGGLGFLDQLSVSPGIFAAYIVIGCIAIVIVVIIFVICCITLNIRRQKRKLLKMGTGPRVVCKATEGLQKTDPAIPTEAGPVKENPITIVVEPGSSCTERTVTELPSAGSSPSTGMGSARMLALDSISQSSSSGMDAGMEPPFSAPSNDCPLEPSSESPILSISKIARCDSHDSGMA